MFFVYQNQLFGILKLLILLALYIQVDYIIFWLLPYRWRRVPRDFEVGRHDLNYSLNFRRRPSVAPVKRGISVVSVGPSVSECCLLEAAEPSFEGDSSGSVSFIFVLITHQSASDCTVHIKRFHLSITFILITHYFY